MSIPTAKRILNPKPPGWFLSKIPRFLRRELPLAEEDIMSETCDIARKTKSFAILLKKGSSAQIVGLFETGLCTVDKESEVFRMAMEALAYEVDCTTIHLRDNIYPAGPYDAAPSDVVLDYRREFHSLLWSVLRNGNVKNSAVQLQMASLICESFASIIVTDMDLSKLHQETQSFISNNVIVNREIEALERRKSPSAYAQANDLRDTDISNEDLFSHAVSDNCVEAEVSQIAFFLRLRDYVSDEMLRMTTDVLASPFVDIERFRLLLKLFSDNVGLEYLVLLRDEDHIQRKGIFTNQKLNALKIFINENQEYKRNDRPALNDDYLEDDGTLI